MRGKAARQDAEGGRQRPSPGGESTFAPVDLMKLYRGMRLLLSETLTLTPLTRDFGQVVHSGFHMLVS